jgi:penicillin-binding protein 1C
MDYYIPAISPTSKCSHLKYVFVSPDEKISYCQSCLPEKGYKKKLFPVLAPEMISYYDQNNISYEHIPAHNPLCQKVFDKNSPRIVSLSEDATYFIEKGETQKIALQCVVSGEVEKVYWYLDDKLIGSCLPSEKMFFEPWPGTIKVSCQDDKGRNTNIRIKVMYY